jgi:flagellar motor switch protein FliM
MNCAKPPSDMDSTETTGQLAKGETSSPSEIESLLASVSGDDSPAATATDSPPANEAKPDGPQRHDFPPVMSYSAGEMRHLQLRHDEFARSLATRLSTHLRMDCSLQVPKLQITCFGKFKHGLSNPTHLALLNLEPLAGTCLLDVPPRLGLSIVDRELGGPAQYTDDLRDLTKIEASLLSKVIEYIAGEWCGVWSDLLELRPKLLRHTNSGRFLRVHPDETPMLLVNLEVKIGEVVEQLQFAVPCSALQPLMTKLNAENESADTPGERRPAAPMKWKSELGEIEILVSAEIPALELTATRLAELKSGDVLPIPNGLLDQIHVCLEGNPKFLGSLGTSGQCWAVRVSAPQ